MHSPASDLTPSRPLIAKLNWVALGLGATLAGTWLWCCWCSFPGNPWNDMRLAPAIALHHGISVYSTAASGPVSTWVYGPVPIFLMWPAGLARTAIGAIEVGGMLHIGFSVVAILTTCLAWPMPGSGSGVRPSLQARLAAALVATVVVSNPDWGYSVFCADASGIVLGLLGLVALARGRHWVAAACVVAAAACKQTLVGMAVGQVVWLALAVSPRAAWRQVGRLAVAGAVAGGLAMAVFGFAGLENVMVQLPGRFPRVDLMARLAQHHRLLAEFVLLPIVAMVGWRRIFLARQAPLLLPSVVFLCLVPLDFAGLVGVGGNLNSIHGFSLWFPATAAFVIAGCEPRRWGRWVILGAGLMAAAIVSFRLQNSVLPTRPNIQAYREATYLAGRMHDRIWFPLNPIVTLYSDGRLYHDLDGLFERELGGAPISDAHFREDLPRQWQASATLQPVAWGLWGIKEGRLPPGTPESGFGLWRIDGRLQ